MRSIRVRAGMGSRRAAILRAAGFKSNWLGVGSAYTSENNGCSDPECCSQHPAADSPYEWGCVETNASGHQAHKIWANQPGQLCSGDKFPVFYFHASEALEAMKEGVVLHEQTRAPLFGKAEKPRPLTEEEIALLKIEALFE